MAKCIGCGIKLQTFDENKPGYVPLLVSADLGEDVYCKRCFQIIHNGKKYDPQISDNDYYDKIGVIKDKPAIVSSIFLSILTASARPLFLPSGKSVCDKSPVTTTFEL